MYSHNDVARPSTPDFLTGGGEMGALMRARDWTSTRLGPPEGWPRALKTAVRLILNTGHPMYIWWSPELFCFYNDAYRRTLGPERHPASLGQPGREVWAEIWPLIGHQVEFVLAGRGSTWDENRLVPITRNGQLDEIYWTYSYSPIDDETAPGGIGGVLVVCAETTQAVLAERQRAAETERQRQLFEQAPGFITILAGPEHVFEFANVAYRRLIGGRDPLGKTVREVLPELEGQGFYERLDRVFVTGERFVAERSPIRLESIGFPPEERFLDFIYEPVTDEAGRVTGIFVEGHDVTDAHRADIELRANTARQAFRLAFEERLRGVDDPDEVMTTAVTMLGEHLNADRVGYGQVLPDDVLVRLSHCYAAGVEPLIGDYPVDSFGPESIARQRCGETEVCPDIEADPGQNPAVWSAIDTRALISVPLVREGRFRASLYVNSRAPRRWTPEDVALVEEVAERTWAAAERARAEDALRASEARLLALARASSDVLYRMSPDWGEMRSLDGGGFLADTNDPTRAWLMDYIPDVERGRVLAAIERAIAEKAPFELEHRVLRADGIVGWTLSRAIPVLDAAGEITEWFGAAADVTARREAEEQLRQLNDTLERQVEERTAALRLSENIVQSDRSPVVAFDADMRVIAFNKAHEDEFFRVFGRHARLGEVLPDLFPPDQAPVLRAMMERALGGESYTVIEAFGDPNLARPHFEVSYHPLNDEAGRIVGAFHRAQDVSDRLRAEAELELAQEALRQSQKLESMGQLTGGVAHDVNNLLTPIMGSLDLLRRRGVGNEREQRMIDGALQSAERAKLLVQRLLAFARRQPLQPVPVDVGALVKGMADLTASTSGPRVRVELDIASDLPPALADANQLEMAVLNLAVNARDAMPDGGTLTISAKPALVGVAERSSLDPGQYIRLSVTDTGAGMDDETLRRAIEPFFSTKGIGKGTGLGLSMVHGLASQLGGMLDIQSSPGIGTCVEVWLPVSCEAARTHAHKAAHDAPATTGTALLVDDEELVRMSTADMLADLGYAVVQAGSAEEALRAVESELGFDLLVTDHLMAGMTGTELAREVRARRPDMPVLVVSGYAEVEGIAPDLPRLTKPFCRDDLAASLGAITFDGRPQPI